MLSCLELKRRCRSCLHKNRLIGFARVKHFVGVSLEASLSVAAPLRPLNSTRKGLRRARLARHITQFLRVLVCDRNLL